MSCRSVWGFTLVVCQYMHKVMGMSYELFNSKPLYVYRYEVNRRVSKKRTYSLTSLNSFALKVNYLLLFISLCICDKYKP